MGLTKKFTTRRDEDQVFLPLCHYSGCAALVVTVAQTWREEILNLRRTASPPLGSTTYPVLVGVAPAVIQGVWWGLLCNRLGSSQQQRPQGTLSALRVGGERSEEWDKETDRWQDRGRINTEGWKKKSVDGEEGVELFRKRCIKRHQGRRGGKEGWSFKVFQTHSCSKLSPVACVSLSAFQGLCHDIR